MMDDSISGEGGLDAMHRATHVETAIRISQQRIDILHPASRRNLKFTNEHGLDNWLTILAAGGYALHQFDANLEEFALGITPPIYFPKTLH